MKYLVRGRPFCKSLMMRFKQASTGNRSLVIGQRCDENIVTGLQDLFRAS
jgi:hypothetical protein